jgi:AraC-like DNA-binding protein
MKEKHGVHFTSVVTDMVELKKCSRSHQSYKNHMHQELSIGIIREGSTKVKFPGIDIEFLKGDGVIIPPKLSHMCSPEDVEHWRFDMLYVDPAFYGEELTFETAKKLTDATLIEEFLAIQKESANQEYVKECLIELLEKLSENNDKDEIFEENKIDNLRLYIEDHWLDRIKLDELELQFRMSKFSMIRNFRKKYNTTPMAYQLQLKMAEAKKLLMQQVSILDVCYELGFYDQAHFTREFYKMNGLSPSIYQENINE